MVLFCIPSIHFSLVLLVPPSLPVPPCPPPCPIDFRVCHMTAQWILSPSESVLIPSSGFKRHHVFPLILLSSCPPRESPVPSQVRSFSLSRQMRKTCEADLTSAHPDPLVIVSH